MFYTLIRNNAFIKPKAIEFWEKLFDDFDASEIWKNVRMNFKNPTIENLDFLLRHNCLLTGMILHKIGLEQDDRCKICMEKAEGVLHIFLNCRKLNGIIKILKKMVTNFIYNEQMDVKEWDNVLLFGFSGKSKNKYVIIIMLSIARYAIWKRRNTMRKKVKEISVIALYEQILTEELQVIYDYCNMCNNIEIKNNLYVIRTWTGFKVLLPKER